MQREQQLKEKIMRHVWTTYFVRQATQPMVLGVVLVVSLFALGRLVFVAKVLENASLHADAFGYVTYLMSAFIGTHFVVQFLLILSATLFAFILRDALSIFTRSRLVVS